MNLSGLKFSREAFSTLQNHVHVWLFFPRVWQGFYDMLYKQAFSFLTKEIWVDAHFLVRDDLLACPEKIVSGSSSVGLKPFFKVEKNAVLTS